MSAVFKASDEANLKLAPQSGLTRGELRYAGEFGDGLSDAWHRANEAAARADLDALAKIDRSMLGSTDRIAYDAFKYNASYVLKGYDTGVYKYAQELPIDSFLGAHIQFPSVNSGSGVAPYKTLEDYENGLKRIRGFVAYLDLSIEMMRRGMTRGATQPRVITEKVIAQLDEAIAAGVEGSPFLGPLQIFPKEFSQAERDRLSNAHRAAVREEILPALRRLRTFMGGEYLTASRTGPPGLYGIPGSKPYYAYLLESFSSVSVDPDQIFAQGEAEVSRIFAQVEEVRKKTGFQGSIAQFYDDVRNNPKFKLQDKHEMFARYRAIQARVEPLLPRLFKTVPKAKLDLKPVPPEQESSSGWAYYIVGSEDGRRPGAFYMNTSNISIRTTPRMTSLFLHEGSPGHHFQGSLAQENLELPAFLRFGFIVGTGEGWALYAESLGSDLGVYDDPYQYLGRLDMEMLRALRMVVDTGLHAKGWSRSQAIEYMLKYSSLDRSSIESEVDRYIVWPGQAPAYKIGELTIRRLREKCSRELGADFDIREFHDQVLNSGMLPLAILETKIVDWIAQTKAANKMKSSSGGSR